jgi:hypothetical protein
MKSKIFKLCTAVLLFLFLGASCQKDEIEYADESIEISFEHDISIYKTRRDYFNYVFLQITEEGKLNNVPSYILSDPRISVDAKGNAEQNFRWRLKSGYILDKEASHKKVFTDITIREYIEYNSAHNIAVWPDSLISPRIIDRDPFIEYYYSDDTGLPEVITIGEINDMIENGSLETVFTKLK